MKNCIIPKNIFKLKLKLIISILFIFTSVLVNASVTREVGPWSALFYRGSTANEIIFHVLTGRYSSFGETIYAAELAYTLDQNNSFRRFFKPVFDVVQIAGSIAYRHDYVRNDNVKEGNLYLIWRFSKFPWDHYLKNSIAIGDGISYDSHPSFADREGKPVDECSRLLNYLLLELTFALPSHPNFELAFRVHHRCTAWGLFPKRANAGSTNVGIGIRYYF